MSACAACRTENPPGSRFCNSCGAALAAAQSVTPTEERKVVTALFCDLIGFTATSEAADPEDVAGMLGGYFALARRHIEAFGGTVEKFIGDAVVGVFGVPISHEDDSERAVRAALRICADARSLRGVGDAPLRLRVGINTGEALVRGGVAPGSGEHFLTGDPINTASRIQSAAPEMGVAVGRSTWAVTRAAFEYAELPAATVKGKAEPVAMFHAIAPRSRLGTDLVRQYETPFVGRQLEVAILGKAYQEAVAACTPRLVTIVGEPGLGKSRIVAELFRNLDEAQDLVTWRQGRCLPYGDGITFWALGEIVKAHAGILETDDPATASDKLDAVVPEGPDRSWLRERLLPLVGIEGTSTAGRDEQFMAWRRFLEALADERPTVLVFEDLHWADPALLAFLEHLADRAEGVPLLIVATARPELFEQHPDFARGVRPASTVTLAPLPDEETARLASALLDATTLPSELRAAIIERSGGNPLYAEELVRLVADTERPTGDGSGRTPHAWPAVTLPASVQAVIAARLDALPADRKAMLANAAVIGKVFWAGAVASLSGIPEEDVVEGLRELTRRELVRPFRRSSMAGQREYAFWHALTRDVAYGQLPRHVRAARHVAAASWIEETGGERLEDRADVLAFHYTQALTLATAAGRTDSAELVAGAVRFLGLAGDRALGIDAAAAVEAFARALALMPPEDPARLEMLIRHGRAARNIGRFSEAAASAEEAIGLARARGDVRHEAVAFGVLIGIVEALTSDHWTTLVAEHTALIDRLPPGFELVEALAYGAVGLAADGRPKDALVLVERAIAVAADEGLPPSAMALQMRGSVRCIIGDAGGFEDYVAALAAADDTGRSALVGSIHASLGIDEQNYYGPRVALETFGRGVEFTTNRGLTSLTTVMHAVTSAARAAAGDFQAVLADAGQTAAAAQAAGDVFNLLQLRASEAMTLTLLGRASEQPALAEWLVDTARTTGRVDQAAFALPVAVVMLEALEEPAAAADVLSSLLATERLEAAIELTPMLPALVRAALRVGELDGTEAFLTRFSARYPYEAHALLATSAAIAEARGDLERAEAGYAEAAARWAGFGVAPEEAFALLGLGRCRAAVGHPSAAEPLGRAAALFESLGMEPAHAEARALASTTGPR